jgi:diguanylate cyclase (GGDEF)-like protein/PAS domain S-box-containing protein
MDSRAQERPKQSALGIEVYFAGYYDPSLSVFTPDSGNESFLGYHRKLWLQPHYLEVLLHPNDRSDFARFISHLSDPSLHQHHAFRFKDSLGRYVSVSLEAAFVGKRVRFTLAIKAYPTVYQAHIPESPAGSNEWMAENAYHYLNIVGAVVITLNVRGEITLINRFACRLLRIDQENAIGLNWFDRFIPSEDRSTAKQAFGRLMKGDHTPRQEVERPIITSLGERRVIRWFNQVLIRADGSRYGILSAGTDITVQEEMLAEFSLVKAMVDNSIEPIICASPHDQFRILYANQAALRHYQVNSHQLYLTTIQDWNVSISQEDLDQYWQDIQHKPCQFVTCHTLSDGTEIPVEVRSNSFEFRGEQYLICVIRDLRLQREYEEAVESAEAKSQLLLEHSKEGIFGLDLDGTVTFANPAAAQMLGLDLDEIVGEDGHRLFHHSRINGEAYPKEECPMLLAIEEATHHRVDGDVFWRKDGSHFPVEYWSSPIFHGHTVNGAVVTFHDITHRKNAEERIRYLAYHDSLTGLPNRRYFQEALVQVLDQNRRIGQSCGLLMMDLDHFKEINDTQGHPVGDALLVEVADRISQVLRSSDTFARLGGDEFAIVQAEVKEPIDTAALAEKILECFEEPFMVSGIAIRTSVSLGLVICDRKLTAEEWVSQADTALYRAKEAGRNHYLFYELAMTEAVKRDAELVAMMSQSSFLKELCVVYHAQHDTRTGAISGLEALVRWHHPEKGLVDTESFIHIAEKRGRINEVALCVVKQVCSDVQQWLDLGLSFGRVGINVSPIQMRNQLSMIDLFDMIDASGTPLEFLEVEVTESAYMDASPKTLELINQYTAKGLHLAVDDFGTGYSSMVTLRQLNVSRLKIDKSFIEDLSEALPDSTIIQATVALGHSLALDVVAEGVETQYQYDVLKALKCDHIQGFYLSKPESFDETTARLSKVVR